MAMIDELKKQKCQSCEDLPVEIKITAATLDGFVQDRAYVCRPCAKEIYSFEVGGE